MNDIEKFGNFKIDRRGFLGRSALASFGLGGMAQTFSQLSLIEKAASDVVNIGDDYKALVCIFLRGGCDQNFFFVPRAAHSQAATYTDFRGIAGIANGVDDPDITIPITPSNPGVGADEFGLNPQCTNMASMFNSGEMAIFQNIGTLAEPTTKTAYQDGSAILPVQLFSHSNQVQEWMATAAEKPFTAGWAGAISSLVNSTENPDGLASMLITAAGNNNWLVSPGGGPAQYSVSSAGAVTLSGYRSNGEPAYFDAIDDVTGHYRANAQGRRLKAQDRITEHTPDHVIAEGYNEIMRRARAGEGLVGTALSEADAIDGTGAGQVDFSGFPNTNLGGELELIAKLIAGRRCLGNRRQIFFCDLGGFDNHASINANLTNLLGQVDAAVGHFNQVMKDLAVVDADLSYNDVTTFQMSDFNRTFTPNGENVASNGTDHAWGTHAWCFGGAVNGGKLYGTYPDLDPNAGDSVNGRGRFIPTTSIDQYGAVLASWFGVAQLDLPTIFPNYTRFDNPFTVADLAFLDETAV